MLSSFRTFAISTILLELVSLSISVEFTRNEKCCLEITQKSNNTQLERFVRDAETGRGMMDEEAHDVEKPKSKPWLGYYDFLITEGSYKFWVVFELFTIAILIYSAFAALYYARYTINDYENYDDYFLGRSARSIDFVPSTQTTFLGLPMETYIRIFEAVANYNNKYT